MEENSQPIHQSAEQPAAGLGTAASAAQAWQLGTVEAEAAPQARATAVELRPLSLGEILDRTFALYRSHFWLFAGLAAISGAASTVAGALQATAQHLIITHLGPGVARLEAESSSGVVFLLALPVQAIIQAAMVGALGAVVLGRVTTVKASLSDVVGRWYRWLGVLLWQLWSMFWVALLLAVPAAALFGLGIKSMYWLAGLLIFFAVFGGGIYGVYAYLRNSVGLPVAVLEGLSVRASMRRSKTLTMGAKGRLLVLGLVVYAISMVAGVLEMPVAFFIARTPLEPHVLAHAGLLLVNFIAAVFVGPVLVIGLALIYFDQRVRQEAYDLEVMLGPEAVVSPAPAYSAPAYESPVPPAPEPSVPAPLQFDVAEYAPTPSPEEPGASNGNH